MHIFPSILRALTSLLPRRVRRIAVILLVVGLYGQLTSVAPWLPQAVRRAAAEVVATQRTPATTAPPSSTPQQPSDTCVVAWNHDGDTLTCQDATQTRIRLLLIDAPELAQGESGRVAKAALTRLAPPGTPLRVEFDVQRTDRYRRTLAYLWLPDGRLLNEALADAGVVQLATYPPNVRYVESIRRAVTRAREAKRGLWADPDFATGCSPADFRRHRCR